MEKSRSLFHYTTAEGLLGIIRDCCLWATHADFSNDTSECKLIVQHLKPVLEAEHSEIIPKLSEVGILKPELLQKHGTGFFDTQAQKTIETILMSINNLDPIYITSFCIHDKESEAEQYQHGLLSQWRGYARGGFAIEFDEYGLGALNQEEEKKWDYQKIF